MRRYVWLIALGVLYGCAGHAGPSPLPGATTQSIDGLTAQAAAGQSSLLLVADGNDGKVLALRPYSTSYTAPLWVVHASINGDPVGVSGATRLPNGALAVATSQFAFLQAAILIYNHPERSPSVPDAIITGPRTGLYSAGAIASDALGRMYTYVIGPEGVYSIVAFAPGASGDVAPIATISGSKSMIGQPGDPEGITVDSAGNIYVATYPGKVLEFAAGASGNVPPTHVLSGLPIPAIDVALDPNGNLYVAAARHVLEYRRGAWGHATPIRDMFAGKSKLVWPIRLAICGDDTLYVEDLEYNPNGPPFDILVYSPGWSSSTPPRAIIGGHLSQVDTTIQLRFY